MTGPAALPVIDVAPLLDGAVSGAAGGVAEQIQAACRERGFFYVTGHGVPAELLDQLAAASAEFFALPVADKMEIAMERGGRAWRGYFPVGGELTSGEPDLKEGLYFGAELPGDDPRVLAGLPLHGRNLFPRQLPRLRNLVLSYLDALTGLGQSVLSGVALSLGLDAGYFAATCTADPTILFRIFSYPPSPSGDGGWGVGEHTDYGLLTLLAQDDSGGLQVATQGGWIDAPPIPGTFVCNIGDMLDRLTGGWYRSTPHRVRNISGRTRLSFPFFFDPGFAAEVPPLPGRAATGDDGRRRWDGQDLRAFTGTYGDYLLGKVSKVFPQLRQDVLLLAGSHPLDDRGELLQVGRVHCVVRESVPLAVAHQLCRDLVDRADEQVRRFADLVGGHVVAAAFGQLGEHGTAVVGQPYGLRQYVPLDRGGAIARAAAGEPHQVVGLRRGAQPEHARWLACGLPDPCDPHDVGGLGGDPQHPLSRSPDDQRRPVTAESAVLHRFQRRDAEPIPERGLLLVPVRGEDLAQLADRRGQPLRSLPERLPGDAGLVELPLHVPGAESDLETALGQDVGGRDLPGQQRRVPERDVDHHRPHPDPLGDRRRRDDLLERRGIPEVVGGEDRVVPEILRPPAEPGEIRL
jgi:isopenicillin N synthase-like dioxygenase